MKKFIVACLVACLFFTGVMAGGPSSPGLNRKIFNVANITGLSAGVIDGSSTTIDSTLQLAGRRVYPRCFAHLKVTSLTGTAPNAAVFIDQSYDLGQTYADVAVTFTACTAACDETKVVQFGGTVDALVYPSTLRIRRTTTGTAVTDLDYEVYLTCADF